jgi:aminomethyltransferase
MTIIGVTGPNAAKMLASAGLTGDLAPLQFSDLAWNGATVTLVRGDNPSFPNYEIWVPTEEVERARDALVKAGGEPVHDETLETFRILCGIPKVGPDIKERILPQETGQERALNFTKGCYIGQEIVERIRARGNVHRAFMGFEIEGPAPAPGTKIQSGGKDVGEITSVSSAPLKNKRLALGYLRKEAAAAEALTAGETTVKPRELPFTGIFD